ncbi:MAG: hypothetical protein Q8M31_05480 [Beijerinckiaceae bacterium]|nr:hypothetical protein [Beijerinckiaceae bacterium]
MHAIIGNLRAWDKTTLPVIKFDCYIDTIGIFFPMIVVPKADWSRLCDLYGGKPHRYRNRKKRYMLVFFQCPQPALLRELSRLCRQYCGNIYRLDLAYDARIDEVMTVEQQFVFLKEHMLMIKRSAQRILEIRNVNGTFGYYWVPHAHVQGAPRDVCIYWDKVSKLDPYNIVAHIDFRLRGDWLRGLGDSENIDPSELILRHMRFVEFDRTKCLRTLFRNVMKKAKNLDQARRTIAYRKRHGQIDFVQRIYDEHRITLHTNNDLVRLPHTLTWGAKRRARVEKTMNNEINALGRGDCIWGAH